jgi:hypothetical protein
LTLHLFPGSYDVRWKSYAALCNAAAAVALMPLCLAFGLSRRTALIASAVSASGFGSLYTLHDPFTSDPLMFVMGPVLTYQLSTDRIARAGVTAVIGVFAKEFAAAPVYAFAACAFVERRWLTALRAVVAGNYAFLTWVALTVSLMLGAHYTWGRNGVGSANFSEGAALAMWLREQSWRGVASAMFNEFGALYLLVPVGFVFAPPRLRRLALVSVPIAAVFCIVQQPDRALWNFHYLIVPCAAIVLAAAPPVLAWTTVALFAVGNLRLGAQLPIAAVSHVAIVGSLVLAAATAVLALRGGMERFRSAPAPMTRTLAIAIAAQALLAAVVGLVVLDMRAHNRVEELGGVNVWGYRGTELGRKRAHEVRIAVFGGDLAFGWGVRPTETLAHYAGRLVSVELNRPGRPSRPVTPIVAAARGMGPADFAGWMEHFRGLAIDVILLVPDDPARRLDEGRFLPDRHSALFAATGYSPILPLVLREKAERTGSTLLGVAARLLESADVEASPAPHAGEAASDSLRDALRSAQQVSRIGTVLVLPPHWNAPLDVVETPRLRIVRLDADPELRNPGLRLDGYHFSAGGHSRAAVSVAPAVLDLIQAVEGQ